MVLADLGSSLFSVEWIQLPPLVQCRDDLHFKRCGQNDTSPACRSRRTELKMFKSCPGLANWGQSEIETTQLRLSVG